MNEVSEQVMELATIRGLIIPAVWDAEGAVTGVAIAAFNENEYLVEGGPKARRLLSLLRREVEVTARLRPVEAAGRPVIAIETYRVKKRRSGSVRRERAEAVDGV